MVDERLKHLEGSSRRNFLRFTAAAGAVFALDRAKVLDVVADSAGTAMADEAGVKGKNITPFLLAHIVELTGGNSLKTNIQLAYNNARAAAQIAVELAK